MGALGRGFGSLLGSALVVTWAGGGRQAVGAFLSRYLIWRWGVGRWVLVLFALPALTVAVAAASGTLRLTSHGWGYAAGTYLVQTLVTEHSRSISPKRAPGAGSSRPSSPQGTDCSVPRYGHHHCSSPSTCPCSSRPAGLGAAVTTQVVVLLLIAPFFRYVIAESYTATGGSLLAAGILHASFNASGKLGFPGGWQFLPALLLLAAGVAIVRRYQRRRVSALGVGVDEQAPRPNHPSPRAPDMAGYDHPSTATGITALEGRPDVRGHRCRTHAAGHTGTANVAHLHNAGAAFPPQQVTDAVIAHLHREAAIGGYEAASAAAQQVEHTYAATARLLASTPTSISGWS